MAAKLSDNENLVRIFRDSLLVWLRQGALGATLAGPPFALPLNVRITSASEPLLKIKRGRRTAGNLTEWPRLGLHAKPNPVLAFVLEGPVDLGVGVTERMAAASGGSEVRGVYQLRLPSQSLLVYPAHVPTTDGEKPHWAEKGVTPLPDSRILWMDIMAEGAILHTCRTRAGSHTCSQFVFVFDTHLSSLTDSIIEELQTASPDGVSVELAQSLLQVLLLRVARSLSRRDDHKIEANALLKIAAATNDSAARSSAVKRACRFIEGHLNQNLTVEKIAGQSFASPAHLNRLFRAELQQSVMAHVNEQRLARAKSLLKNTTLPVHSISDNLGIRNAVYFSRMFRAKTGMTPLEYRRSRR